MFLSPLGKSKSTAKKEGSPTKIPKYPSGQHKVTTGYCMATKLNGNACTDKCVAKYLPLCSSCMKKGDPSLAVIKHPRFGKTLICRRALPKGYKMALWGDVLRKDTMPDADQEWGFETEHGDFINPCPYPSSQVKFSQCPGPHERVNLTWGEPHILIEPEFIGKNSKGICDQPISEKYGSMLFQTNQAVPKNSQLTMMYADDEPTTKLFFEERGLVRCDVSTADHSAPLKKGVRKSDLKFTATKKEIAHAKERQRYHEELERMRVADQKMKKNMTGKGSNRVKKTMSKKSKK